MNCLGGKTNEQDNVGFASFPTTSLVYESNNRTSEIDASDRERFRRFDATPG